MNARDRRQARRRNEEARTEIQKKGKLFSLLRSVPLSKDEVLRAVEKWKEVYPDLVFYYESVRDTMNEDQKKWRYRFGAVS